MTLLDLDPARAQAVADAHGGGKASAAEIDARSVDDLAAAIGDAGVLVNTASYRINLEAMRACLQAGCNYLDLGGLYWMTRRQRELGADFERAGLLAVLGIGSSPGKTNLMAARGVRELGARAVRDDRRDGSAAATRPRPTTGGCDRRTRSRRCSTSSRSRRSCCATGGRSRSSR